MAVIRDKYILDIETKGATQGIGRLGGALKGLGFAAVAAGVAKLGSAMNAATREFETYTNQLRLITSSQEELEGLMGRLEQAAVKNRAAFGDTVDLFTKLTLATEELNISQERVLDVTGKFQQALAISGADANTAAGAIRQFGQAMASGTVRGDEFNSIVEALGPALAIMARESGNTVGQLRQMSQNGELTAEAFFAMVEGSNALTAAFNSTNATTDQLEQQLNEAFKGILRDLDEAIGLTSTYRGFLVEITQIINDIRGTSPTLSELVETEQFEAAIKNIDRQISSMDQALGRMAFNAPWNDTYEQLEANIAALQEQRAELVESLAAQEANADAAKKQADALSEHEKALQAVLAPHKEFIDSAQKFADADYSTPLEKANQRVINAEIVIEQLRLAFERSNGQIDNFVMLLRGAENELAAAQEQVTALSKSTQELNKSSADEFYDGLVEGARRATTEQTNAQLAIERLKNDLASGKINIDQYAIAMERLNNILGRTSTVGQDAAKTFSQGWKTAFDEYKKNAMDASALAERAFRQSTQGLEDAIVSFAKTGKFEWKEFVLGIQEELLRANIKQVIVNTLKEGGNLTDVMKQFGGISGGAISIPQSELNTLEQLGRMGQFNTLTQGIGGGTPQPTSTNVTYNIDAVDAQSFKTLVARDPEFIHAVAEAGARMSPRRV
jgi:lambda family phage tail tape measure protein